MKMSVVPAGKAGYMLLTLSGFMSEAEVADLHKDVTEQERSVPSGPGPRPGV